MEPEPEPVPEEPVIEKGALSVITIPRNASLYIDNKQLCTYADAESAAADVFTQSTGFPLWDSFDGRRYELPEDLSWWEEAAVFSDVVK